MVTKDPSKIHSSGPAVDSTASIDGRRQVIAATLRVRTGSALFRLRLLSISTTDAW